MNDNNRQHQLERDETTRYHPRSHRRSLNSLSWVAIAVLWSTSITAVALAQPGYRINGIPAPQVQPKSLANTLKAQLQNLQRQLDQRAQHASLGQALEAGLLNNPQLATSYAQIQGQQWSLIAVRRQWYPTLSASSNPYVPGQSFNTTTQSNQASYSNGTGIDVGINLNWTFFDPTRGASINSASESLRQQQLLFDVSARNLVLEIQQAYYSLQEQRLLIKAFAEVLDVTTRQVAITEAQFNNGMLSIADVEQIHTQQFSTLSTLINAYRLLIDASSRLAQTMALPAGTLVLPNSDLSPQGRWDEPLQSTIDQALRLREEIQARLAQAASANWSATALFNRYWPQFSLGASGGYASNTTTGGFPGDSPTMNSQSLSWNGGVGIALSWQLFDGGISAAQAESQKAAARAARDQAAEWRLSVTREVEQAYASYLTSMLALESSKAQADAARNAANAVEQRYAVGVTDMATVVQTLEQAIRAANVYATAIRAYNDSVATLYRSSARWPDGIEPVLQRRVSSLKQR